MDPHAAFQIAGLVAITGWAALVAGLFLPGLRERATAVARFVIPSLLAAAYVVLLAQGWGKTAGGGFGSIEQVRLLFSVDAALAAGWLHYLAFDLFIGSWIVTDGLEKGVGRWLLIPCLALTFLFGPAGLLLYLATRLATRKGDG